MFQKIVIIDFGMGNLRSIANKFKRLGTQVYISSDINQIRNADKIILPGVGHFASGMKNFKNLELTDTLQKNVRIEKKPILGICLGMQLFSQRSEEGNVEGLKWINSEIRLMQFDDYTKYKVPHIGWNSVSLVKDSVIMRNVSDNSEFYFTHSYAFEKSEADYVVGNTNYGIQFPSVVEQENIFGVQFHPEKSHECGDIVLKNFIEL